MLKNKYALDLDYNFYCLNTDLEKYIFPEEEIKYILENKSAKDIEDNGKIILYDHKQLYLIPGKTAELLKLNSKEKIELLHKISNTKIKDITPENIKEISLLLHYSDYLLPAEEDNDVTAYEMPVNLLYQRLPFYQKMFHLTEEAQFRKDDVKRTGTKLTQEISSRGTEEKLTLSKEAEQYLTQNNGVSWKNEPDWKEDYKKLQQLKNNYIKSESYQSEGVTEKKKSMISQSNSEETKETNAAEDIKYQDYGNKSYNYNEIRERFHLEKEAKDLGNNKYKITGQISNKVERDKTLSTAFMPPPDKPVDTSTTGIIGSKTPIKYLIQDNHPEKLLGDGTGNMGKHTVPGYDDPNCPKNNLLTSYHENRITNKEGENNDRSTVYNFTAQSDDTELTFHRANFEVSSSGAYAGALAAGGDFKKGNLSELKNNAYIKDKEGNVTRLDEKKIEELKKEGKITEEDGTFKIKLNNGETFSFQPSEVIENKEKQTTTLSPVSTVEENEVFASLIEFSNNKDIDVTINSVNKTGTDPTVKGSDANKEWFEPTNDLRTQKGYYKFTEDMMENIPPAIKDKFNTPDKKKILTDLMGKIISEPKGDEELIGLSKEEKEKEEKEIDDIKESLTKKDFTDEEANKILHSFLVGNYDMEGNPKQASGVFENPNYDVTGTITPGSKENNYETPVIILPPPEITKNESESNNPYPGTPPVDINTEKYYSKGKYGEEDVINEGAFSQNFHYKLKIDNYDEKNPSKYEVIAIPGGDVLTVPGQSKPEIAKPNDLNNTAISLPCKVIKENGECYIEFDYFVTGGSGNPVYAKIFEKEGEK